MNKMIKGSVAGATGIALLMGGFGTYALWRDSVPGLNGGSISSGQLTIDKTTGPGTWYDASTTAAISDSGAAWTKIANTDVSTNGWATIGGSSAISAYTMVPGDTFVLRQPLKVHASGHNLKARLVVSGVKSDFPDLKMHVEYAGQQGDFNNWTTGATDPELDYGTGDISSLNTAGTPTTDDDVAQITFTLPAQSSAASNIDQLKEIDLSNVTVTLQQVRD